MIHNIYNYWGMIKAEIDLPSKCLLPSEAKQSAFSNVSRRLSVRKKNRGLNDFPTLFTSSSNNFVDEITPTPPPVDVDWPVVSDSSSNFSTTSKGVYSRYEYYGPPIDDFSLINLVTNQQQRDSASTSGCCSHCCSGSLNNVDDHERCIAKYNQLEGEIAKLKAQISQLSKSSKNTVLPSSYSSNLSSCSITNSAKACPGAPPPPPPPPADFLRPKIFKLAPGRSSTGNGQWSGSKSKRRLSNGNVEDETMRLQMDYVLKDLENGRANLRPVQKSPGGTPRKCTMNKAGVKSYQDLLAEALRSKFANVHRQSPLGPCSGAYFSDGENSSASWLDENTPTPKKPNLNNIKKDSIRLQQSDSSPFNALNNRPRMSTVS